MNDEQKANGEPGVEANAAGINDAGINAADIDADEIDDENTAHRLGEARRISKPLSDDEAEREIRRRARRGFLIGGAAAVAAYGGYRYLWSAQDAGGIPAPLRRAHEFNERLSTAYFDDSRLAQTYPREQSSMPRANGGFGLEDDFDPATWSLRV